MNPALIFELEINEAERKLLLELLEEERTELFHGIHHADKSAMRRDLTQREEMVEALVRKLSGSLLAAE